MDEGPKGTAGFEVIDFAGLRHDLQLSHPVKITSIAVEKRDADVDGPRTAVGTALCKASTLFPYEWNVLVANKSTKKPAP